MKRFLVVQHMPWEGPGRILRECFEHWGIEFSVVEACHEPIPEEADHEGLICLGGSPNVDEEDRFPYLHPLKRLLGRYIEQDKAYYLGFCLGHQLLAHVLGAKVGPNPIKSIGFTEGSLTEAGLQHPLFRGLPTSFPLFKWHGQAVQSPLPDGLECLVQSPHCAIEAIAPRGKPHVVGLQFDNHAATVEDVGRWIEGDRAWIHAGMGVVEDEILRDARRLEPVITAQFRRLFENFLTSSRLDQSRSPQ